MDGKRRSPILIPDNKLARLLDANRTALLALVMQAVSVTGKGKDLAMEIAQIRYTGNIAPNERHAMDAVGHIGALMAILRYMTDRVSHLKDPNLVTVFMSDYETIARNLLSILKWLDSGDPYELDDDVLALTLQVRAARVQKQKVDATKIIADLLYRDDPAKLAELSGYAFPTLMIKYIREKKIPLTDAVRTVNREFAAKHKRIETEIEALRVSGNHADAYWQDLYKRKDHLIEKWKTALQAIT